MAVEVINTCNSSNRHGKSLVCVAAADVGIIVVVVVVVIVMLVKLLVAAVLVKTYSQH